MCHIKSEKMHNTRHWIVYTIAYEKIYLSFLWVESLNALYNWEIPTVVFSLYHSFVKNNSITPVLYLSGLIKAASQSMQIGSLQQDISKNIYHELFEQMNYYVLVGWSRDDPTTNKGLATIYRHTVALWKRWSRVNGRNVRVCSYKYVLMQSFGFIYLKRDKSWAIRQLGDFVNAGTFKARSSTRY